MRNTVGIVTVNVVFKPWKYEVKASGVMPNITELYRDYMAVINWKGGRK